MCRHKRTESAAGDFIHRSVLLILVVETAALNPGSLIDFVATDSISATPALRPSKAEAWRTCAQECSR
jgi:hypothetical protein